ncbi:Fic family protein [Dolosigranulum pigrum]|uniref:Fic family protein n=1 Tax=Dolosigranulum pigrum TaxID=29394 RepID=UPI00191A74A7|nr:Fic family protein [Dolosigranulum pigrum]QTJ42777.1 Fic family protein [Dolosigranulum pigrum]QTJ46175.1 Fic family protein [Dolosigranulum pigrum]QTJ55837.1 Fic family protein [Dolosigranulum pigrum]QTJ59694.1 Fic family protein [Dolosigranulum pigrum]
MTRGQSFVPDLLPPDDKISIESIVGELIQATSSLKVLGEKIRHTQFDYDILLFPFLTQEAAASTRIENTQVTVDEIYEVTAGDKSSNKDINEAINYMRALEHGKSFLDATGIFSKTLLKDMHYILLSGDVRGSNKNPGQFKSVENYIGKHNAKRNQAEFIPPGPEHTDSLIDNLVDYINSDVDDKKILVKTAIIHSQFETIHPFMDGNGRIGRVLIPLFLYYKGVLPYPLFFLSHTLEQNRFEYYRKLNNTRWEDDFDGWVQFFIRCTLQQTNEYSRLIDSWLELYEEGVKVLKIHHRHHQVEKFMAYVCSNPIFSLRHAEEKTGITYQSCRSYAKTLNDNQIIESDQQKRNKMYYHYEILNLIR